jgi:pimeloyl-ACP methyl ester carboxylesterase
MDHLHLDKAIIGGISMGAGVALNFTLRNPAHVLGLILCRPAWLDGPMAKHNKEIFKYISKLIQEHGAITGSQLFMASDLYRKVMEESPVTAQSFAGQFNYEKASETAMKFECLPEDSPVNNRDDWKMLTTPTLVLANKSDPVHPFEYGLEYASNIVQSDFKEITPKAISEQQHNNDVQKNIDLFIANLLKQIPHTIEFSSIN